MKRNYFPLAFLLFASMFFSCNSQEEYPIDVKQTEQLGTLPIQMKIDAGQEVTKQTAENVANLFSKRTFASRSADSDIQDVCAINDSIGNPLCYVINYTNSTGFIIVSATKDYHPILAYSDTGRFEVDKINTNGTSVWLDEQSHYLSLASELPDSIKMKYRAMWTQYSTQELDFESSRSESDVYNLISRSINGWTNQGYTVYRLSEYKNSDEFRNLPSDVQETLLYLPSGYANPNYGGCENVSFVLKKDVGTYNYVSPLLNTTWGQWGNYNLYVPTNCPVGCIAVAVGQIMKYYQYPTTDFAWSSMPNNYATTATATLMADIGQKVKMDYKPTGSSAKNSDALNALINNYNYSASKIDHNASLVRNELDNGRPVYMTGFNDSDFFGLINEEGHAWVCDGYHNSNTIYEYKLMTLEQCPSSYEPTMFLNPYTTTIHESYTPSYYHMNWGLDGTCNGYYLDDNMVITLGNETYHFKYNREDFINIQPH